MFLLLQILFMLNIPCLQISSFKTCLTCKLFWYPLPCPSRPSLLWQRDLFENFDNFVMYFWHVLYFQLFCTRSRDLWFAWSLCIHKFKNISVAPYCLYWFSFQHTYVVHIGETVERLYCKMPSVEEKVLRVYLSHKVLWRVQNCVWRLPKHCPLPLPPGECVLPPPPHQPHFVCGIDYVMISS